MTDTHNPEGDFDAEERRQQIIAHLESLDADSARNEVVTALPYYHSLENEITKSKQGIFVTSYFLTKWAPTLGYPAMNIVLALQKLADKEGKTTAKLETIGSRAGVSVPTLKRWLSTNPKVWENRSPEQRRQWELLHKYFIIDKEHRGDRVRTENGKILLRRTSNRVTVALDDPVHPDDIGKFYALAAERMVQDEFRARRQQAVENKRDLLRDHRDPLEIRWGQTGPETGDNSLLRDQADPSMMGSQGSRISLSDRINVTNVNRTRTRTGSRKGRLADDPRVANLTPEQRAERERAADLIDQTIKKLEGDRTTELHRSAGFHRRVALLMDPTLVHEALAATQDAMQRERSGEHTVHKGPAAYFGGAVLQIALKQGIDLGMGQPPAERRIEPLARPESAPAAALPATTGAQHEAEASSPEETARIYAEHLFPWKYRQENGGREPSEVDKQAAYERRLEELNRPRS